MFTLYQEEHIIGKSGEGSKTSAETGNEEYMHISGNKMSFFSYTEENADDKTTHDVYGKSSPGKGGYYEIMGQFTYQKTETSSDETSDSGN